jgi:predicted metal-dependent phosphoesterase TrpH
MMSTPRPADCAGVIMLKVELHAHTDLDPADRIPHSTEQLIERAAALGYHALAVTLHDRYFDPAPFAGFARAKGVVLMAGVERTVAHRHVLLVNFPVACMDVRSFDDIAHLKAGHGRGLVVAPHPFYPVPSALRSRLEQHAAVWDAVEVNAMYTMALNFNRRAIAWAGARGLPLVGNSDLHILRQMGTTYSLVDAAPDADAICRAIREGRVEVRSEPLSWPSAAGIYGQMLAGGARGRLGALRDRRRAKDTPTDA